MKYLYFLVRTTAMWLEQSFGRVGATLIFAAIILLAIAGVFFLAAKARRTPGGMNAALISAAVNNHLKSARKLLSKGADVNARAEDFCTPLSLASFNGHQAMVELLLQYGADVNALDLDGKTALVHASEQNRAAVADLLIQHGAKRL